MVQAAVRTGQKADVQQRTGTQPLVRTNLRGSFSITGRTQLQTQWSTSEAGKQQVDQEAVAGHTPAGWEHSFPVDRPTLLATRRVLTAQSVPYTAASGNAVKALCVKGREERKSLGGRHVYHGVSTQ
jgi:hypothetical protein